MQFLNLASLSSVASLLAILTGVGIWFLIRKKFQRLWLPVLRIVQRVPKRMPRLLVTKPPLVAFVCFLIAASMLMLFVLSPAREVMVPLSHEQNRFHVFIDLSPSTSLNASIDTIRNQVEALWDELSPSGQLSFSTSESPKLTQPTNIEDFRAFVATLAFQRGGSRLGLALKQQIEAIGKVSRLYIVSDADWFSWSDFNWRYLAADHEVIYVPIADAVKDKPTNFFFGQVKFLSDPLSSRMTWEVEVASAPSKVWGGGVLVASFDGSILATKEWEIPREASQTRIQIDWPEASLTQHTQALAAGLPITFKIEPATMDAMQIDNEYRATVQGVRRAALVIAEPSGEMLLEDPTYHLMNTLQVLGYSLTRLDYLKQPGPDPTKYSLIVVAGGGGKGIDFFCPTSVETARLKTEAGQTRLPMVWLVPRTLDADFVEMCSCFDRLAMSEGGRESPSYCQQVQNRDGWLGVLGSVGAKQVGGGLADQASALAWQKIDVKSGLDVLAFTIPLRPSRLSGVSYANMPLILKELLTWKGQLSEATGDEDGWPRVSDMLTAGVDASHSPLQSLFEERLKLSNVPIGESLMNSVDASVLPPLHHGGKSDMRSPIASAQLKSDPLPFIRIMLLIVVAALLTEIVWTLAQTWRRRRMAVLGLLFGLLSIDSAQASVRLVMTGYGIAAIPAASELAREVSQRTSIDLSPETVSVDRGAQVAKLEEPWLWIRGVDAVNSSPAFRNEFLLWLKTGGFAVFEDVSDPAKLEAFTKKAFANEPYEARWLPIPPDHELMRSFHLLDTLPTCGIRLWRGLQFDGRLVAVAVPFRFLETLLDKKRPAGCDIGVDQERLTRVFINLLMVVLATDYKKDQIHLPEILKRLR